MATVPGGRRGVSRQKGAKHQAEMVRAETDTRRGAEVVRRLRVDRRWAASGLGVIHRYEQIQSTRIGPHQRWRATRCASPAVTGRTPAACHCQSLADRSSLCLSLHMQGWAKRVRQGGRRKAAWTSWSAGSESGDVRCSRLQAQIEPYSPQPPLFAHSGGVKPCCRAQGALACSSPTAGLVYPFS